MTAHNAAPGYFLHVYEHESRWSKSVETALERLSITAVHRPDVHRALALLLKNRGSPCLAVFISIDWLDERDQPFFGLVARHVGAVPIWAYATRAPAAELATALGSPALRVLEDPGQLDLILARLVPPRSTAPVSADGADSATPVTSDGELPVPWGSPRDWPTRTPPGGERPLLTPEELDALTAAPPIDPHRRESGDT